MSERSTASPDVSPWSERFVWLVSQAREAPEPWRTERVGELHAMLSLLDSRDAEAHTPVLHRLLDEGQLEGLRDESGLASTVAVTRTLLSLGGLGSLTVSPSHLEALRHWEQRRLPSTWGSLALVMLIAFVVQTPFMTFATDTHGLSVSAAVLAGEAPPKLSAGQRLLELLRPSEGFVFAAQSLASLVALVACATVGRRPAGRAAVRRGLLGLGGLGVLASVPLLLAESAAGWGALVSVLGSFLSAYLLKED